MMLLKVLLSLGITSYFATGFSYLGAWTGGTIARWVFLAALAVFLPLVAKRAAGSLDRRILWSLAAWVVYASLSAAWSENGILSLAKASLFGVTAFTFLLTGVLCGRSSRESELFSPLAPLYLLTLFSSIFGFFFRQEAFEQGGLLFQGYVQGPNMLGAMFAFSFPWILSGSYRDWGLPLRRTVWLTLGALGGIFLLLIRSRSALLMTLIMGCASLMALPFRRRFILGYGAILLAILSITFSPGTIDSLANRYIVKGPAGASAFASRAEPLRASWEAARNAWVFGVGFGVSAGRSSDWKLSLSDQFGREKSNSQLAVIEELGMPGLALYLVLIGTIALSVLSSREGSCHETTRFHDYLMAGFFVGALAGSAIEAWFTAPGSPEFAGFWGLVGLGLGHRAIRFRSPRQPEVPLTVG